MKQGCKCVLGEGKGYVEGSLQLTGPREPESLRFSDENVGYIPSHW